MTPQDESAPSRRSWQLAIVKRSLQWTVVLMVIATLLLTVQQAMLRWQAETATLQFSWRNLQYSSLALAAGLYSLALIPGGLILRRGLAALGEPVSLMQAIVAQVLGHLGKYVPGKAMVLILRTGVLRRLGAVVSIRAATIAIFLETLTGAAAAVLLGAICFPFLAVGAWTMPGWLKWASLALAVCTFIGTSPAVLKKVIGYKLIGGELKIAWRWSDMGYAWFWNLVCWLLMGGSLAATASALPMNIRDGIPLSPNDLFLVCIVGASLSYVAGFLSMLPGGAGVRELVMTNLLAPVIGLPAALVVAIAQRLLQISVELLVGSVCWFISPQAGSTSTDMDQTHPHS